VKCLAKTENRLSKQYLVDHAREPLVISLDF